MKFNKGAPDNDLLTEWHKVFVWFPVTIWTHNSSTGKEQKVWLEDLWRKRVYVYPTFSKEWFWVYSDHDRIPLK